jgi:hypothetical protein
MYLVAMLAWRACRVFRGNSQALWTVDATSITNPTAVFNVHNDATRPLSYGDQSSFSLQTHGVAETDRYYDRRSWDDKYGMGKSNWVGALRTWSSLPEVNLSCTVH